jgi:hypothetical protein
LPSSTGGSASGCTPCGHFDSRRRATIEPPEGQLDRVASHFIQAAWVATAPPSSEPGPEGDTAHGRTSVCARSTWGSVPLRHLTRRHPNRLAA